MSLALPMHFFREEENHPLSRTNTKSEFPWYISQPIRMQ